MHWSFRLVDVKQSHLSGSIFVTFAASTEDPLLQASEVFPKFSQLGSRAVKFLNHLLVRVRRGVEHALILFDDSLLLVNNSLFVIKSSSVRFQLTLLPQDQLLAGDDIVGKRGAVRHANRCNTSAEMTKSVFDIPESF